MQDKFQRFIPIFYTRQHDRINHVSNKHVQEFLPVDVARPIAFLLSLSVSDHVRRDYLLPKKTQHFDQSTRLVVQYRPTSVRYGRLR